MKKLICYCFGYSEADIIKDAQENQGTSLIMEQILSEKKKGSCNCAVNNPLGR
ncbi:MAG: hypothetical protein HY808_05360 [Nitrospirae bacterium]|nr:hypothetical protein [Nitrospirota bacterium]